MKNSCPKIAANCPCPAVLYDIHSRPNESVSEECIPKSRRVSVPLFIEQRLLCAVREWRQGNPPLTADHRSCIRTTRACLVETGARRNRSSARQAYYR